MPDNEHERDPEEIGALWVKAGSRGQYMAGKVNGEPVVVFRNLSKREGDKRPDWHVKRPKQKDPDDVAY